MRILKFFLFIAAITCTMLFFACSSQPSAEKQLREKERRKTAIFDIASARIVNPLMWNPLMITARLDQGLHQAMMEPLFILNYQTNAIEPWLGLEMISNTAMDIWTLKLRPGIEWSDGHPFTVDDIIFTTDLLVRNAPMFRYSAQLAKYVKRMRKIDSLNMVFELKAPNPRFRLDHWIIRMWGSCSVVPKHIFKDKDPLTFSFYDPQKGWPVFTGPYVLKNATQTEFNFIRNNNWWGAKTGFKPLPRPEYLKFVWYGPEETRTAAMAASNLDAIMDISLGAFLALKRRNPNIIAWYDHSPYATLDPCPRSLEFNCAVEPWNDKDMRWAVNWAIDRAIVISIAYEGTSVPSTCMFPLYPPLMHYMEMSKKFAANNDAPLDAYNPGMTRSIFESKGYHLNKNGYYEKDGKELGFTITTMESEIEHQRTAQIIVEQLQAAGIDATTRVEATGTWMDNYYYGNFEARIGWESCAAANEPWATMDMFNERWVVPLGKRGNLNCYRWSNVEYSRLVDSIGVLPLGDPRIDSLYAQAMKIWYHELPVVPIAQAKKLIPFCTTYWKGWPTADNPYIQPFTWWQSTQVILHKLEPVE